MTLARNWKKWLMLLLIATMLMPLVGPTRSARAAEKTAAQLMPETTVFYAEIAHPDRVLATLLDHPLSKKIQASPEYRQGLKAPQLAPLYGVVDAMELKMDMKWRPMLQKLTDGGLYVGVDIASKGGVLLAKSSDPELPGRFADALADVARQTAAEHGNDNAVERRDYKGIVAYKINKGVHAAVGPWLVISNQGDLARAVADAYLGGQAPSLDDETEFRAARSGRRDGAAGWAYLKMRTLREMGVGREAFANRLNNPGVEFLLGGVLSVLRRADFVTLDLLADDTSLRAAINLPRSEGDIPKARAFYFGPEGEGGAPKPLRPEGTLLNLTMYRDLAAMWNAAPDLFDEDTAAKLAKADTDLSNFFGGRPFGAEILPAIGPRSQLLVVQMPADPDAKGPAPQIKIPAAAFVLQSPNPEKITPFMKVAFQTLIAFANIDGASKGRPTLMLTNEKREAGDLVSAEYLVMPGDKPMANAEVYYNFSPALAISGDTIIIASTKRLAESLMTLAKAQAGQTVKSNTLLEINGAATHQALAANREQLIAQNMIKEGHTREQAEAAINGLLQLVELIKAADVHLTRTDKTLSLELGVQIKPVSE
ncbi:MAG: hypothetical protein GC159_06410 [Phycisphaera sp.]|nr:hypothetical protein [Phycisphaera sp.]